MTGRIQWPTATEVKAYRETACCGLVEARNILSQEAIRAALTEAQTPAEIAEINKEIWLAVIAKRVQM